MNNTVGKQITVWIAIVAVLFVMLFSTAYISHHTEHNCTGEDCPVCAVIAQCTNNLRSIEAIIVAVIIELLLCKSIQEKYKCTDIKVFSCSLISQKVRMNN